ncbi:5-hydroxytryptamine receptor 3A-like isoform X2 [Betta splendens]|uniref:5-hydroxytryptamine receptor 3A-like isoform X2 n=1 Tax=Betta splendens TaxID=158456 RepID=A0A6P7L6H7_BETSP|nr:5-hydroxytryptamine receptor 3A-like isoform X2 [Betta splendens]
MPVALLLLLLLPGKILLLVPFAPTSLPWEPVCVCAAVCPGVAASTQVCSYQDVLEHLNLTADSSAFRLTRPVLDHRRPTVVQLDIILSAILAVTEKTQTFIPFVWTLMTWTNERISWDPERFCGIRELSVPKSLLWKPDLFIYEMIHKHETATTPYYFMSYNGNVYSEQVMKLVSTCQMDLHKFPFDTQRCNITVGSAIHCVKEMRFIPFSNSTRATQFSREVMLTQGDWDFLQLMVTSRNFSFKDQQWEQIIYTFTMKRRPLLHIINFLLPVLFFLFLDLASFFISDHRGEKLGFKVTVLLAMSVLLLILNDILPSTSNKTPLIATYCIVIFGLMLLSLLEAILVTYLVDLAPPESVGLKEDKQEEAKADAWDGEDRQTSSSSVCRVTTCETEQELLPMAEQVIGADSPESRVTLLILEELRKLQNAVKEQLSGREEGRKCLQWASRINKAFFIFYLAAVSLFLSFIFIEWMR